MSNIASQRIKREFAEVARSDEAQKFIIKVELIGDDFRQLKGEISGPPDTPYEGGRFTLDINIPDTYPFNPPKVKFSTRIWHPNISSVTGVICLDILREQWAAAMTLRTVLLSIQALLAVPEPDDPQDAVVASQYISDRQLYNNTARFWTARFAGGKADNSEWSKKISHLVDMGVSHDEACSYLSAHNFDLEKAIERIFG